MKFASLFQPLKINSLMIPNRIISAPMNEALNNKRVRCGAGILIAGCGGVDLPNAWFDRVFICQGADSEYAPVAELYASGRFGSIARGHAHGQRRTWGASG